MGSDLKNRLALSKNFSKQDRVGMLEQAHDQLENALDLIEDALIGTGDECEAGNYIISNLKSLKYLLSSSIEDMHD